jgi:hypothetical protein
MRGFKLEQRPYAFITGPCPESSYEPVLAWTEQQDAQIDPTYGTPGSMAMRVLVETPEPLNGV